MVNGGKINEKKLLIILLGLLAVTIVISAVFLLSRNNREKAHEARPVSFTIVDTEEVSLNDDDSTEKAQNTPDASLVWTGTGPLAYDTKTGKIYISRALTEIKPESVELSENTEFFVYTFYMEGKPSEHAFYEVYNDGKIESIYYNGEDNVLAVYAQVPIVFEIEHNENEIILSFKTYREVYDKIVYLDPGHGGIDDGVVRDGHSEKDLSLIIANMVFELINEGGSGIKAVMSRTEDVFLDKYVRAERGSIIADIIVSIHCNSYEQKGAKGAAALFNDINGAETLYNPNQTLLSSRTGLNTTELASIMQRNLCAVIDAKNRGLQERTNLVITTGSFVPAVIMEVGYMSNKNELQKLIDEEYQKQIAIGIYNGILEAFGVKPGE